MKEQIKELKKQFKETLVEIDKSYYNDNIRYVKLVGKNFFVLDKTTTKNGIVTKVFQTTNDVLKARLFTFDEAIDDYFATNTNKYTSFSSIYKGFGVFDLCYDYGKTQDIFEEYLELENEK